MMGALLFGWFGIGSLMMGVAWAKVTYTYYQESGLTWWGFLKSIIWDREHMISLGLVVNSFAVVFACAYLLWDGYYYNRSVLGPRIPVFYAVTLFGMVLSKAMLLWAKSVDATAHKISWPWWGFLVAVILWGLVVAGVR
jgi:hypothetical protein